MTSWDGLFVMAASMQEGCGGAVSGKDVTVQMARLPLLPSGSTSPNPNNLTPLRLPGELILMASSRPAAPSPKHKWSRPRVLARVSHIVFLVNVLPVVASRAVSPPLVTAASAALTLPSYPDPSGCSALHNSRRPQQQKGARVSRRLREREGRRGAAVTQDLRRAVLFPSQASPQVAQRWGEGYRCADRKNGRPRSRRRARGTFMSVRFFHGVLKDVRLLGEGEGSMLAYTLPLQLLLLLHLRLLLCPRAVTFLYN
ncbi:hypothetical protein O3P69_004047 [Scylla paramamosain]|uniref:Uncharacterized protein n=1 Tax=Scylla paramamosain TaxID=85552 RepID=A0AAW0UES4_SCYPA